MSDRELMRAMDAEQRVRELEDEIERLTSQVESLQNKCANRGLSPEDSDALQARVETLEAEARWRANGAFLDKPDPALIATEQETDDA